MYLLLALASLGWIVQTQHGASRTLLIFFLSAVSIRWVIGAVTVRIYRAALDEHDDNRFTQLLSGGFNLVLGFLAEDNEQLATGGAQLGSAVLGRESESLRRKREYVEKAHRHLAGFSVTLAMSCCLGWWWARFHTL